MIRPRRCAASDLRSYGRRRLLVLDSCCLLPLPRASSCPKHTGVTNAAGRTVSTTRPTTAAMGITGAGVLDIISRPQSSAVAAVVCALVCLILTITWVTTYQQCGGSVSMSWGEDCTDAGCATNQGCIFNWHPVLMVASMIFGTTCAVLSYQLPLEKSITKPLHMALLFISFVVICVGLHAVFKYHNTKMFHGKASPIENMTSLHSWLGITTVVLFSAQLTAGAYHFIPGPDAGVPGVTGETKGLYKPLHVIGGLLCVVLPVICCATGMQEKTEFVDRFGIHNGDKYMKIDGSGGNNNTSTQKEQEKADFADFHGSELTHLNFLGLFLLLQMTFVFFAVSRRGGGKPAGANLQNSLMESPEGVGGSF
jgi:hypothetical protein